MRLGFSKEYEMTIHRMTIPDHRRIGDTANLFGHEFPMKLEPYIYAVAGNLAKEYRGGYWQFYRLDNGASICRH